ncbi:hypothetical protein AAFC00_006547 [Neodothiora populina]|uniref:Uncharacterized protein n=1 Tax=Neodothiora populina TaxID=2781224 RepID=A0ABR3PAB1_9PEZI
MLIKEYAQYFLGTTSVLSSNKASVPSDDSDLVDPTGSYGKVCVVRPAPNNTDSVSKIESAFDLCGRSNTPTSRGLIIFPENETYHIASFMDTTSLAHVDINHKGTFLWSTDIDYWLTHSQPVGYQNQSSAWYFGGHDIRWFGGGVGTLDGNGQVWYDFINGQSNYPRRPHQVTIRNTTDSVIEGLRFVQSQMWTMTVISSENILLQDIYVNSTSNHSISMSNTDGADTVYANNITFRRWIVENGDDAIALKANSTNILIEDCEFYRGVGLAMGSIGQFNNTFETIENVTARNIITHNTDWGAYIKTWTGVSKGYSPNGGGGGIGYVSNLTFEDFTLDRTRGIFSITQCTNYEGNGGDCDTSKFNVHDVTIRDWRGTSLTGVVGQLQCSAASPCYGLDMQDVQITVADSGDAATEYLCDSVEAPIGFSCTGPIVGENNAFTP